MRRWAKIAAAAVLAVCLVCTAATALASDGSAVLYTPVPVAEPTQTPSLAPSSSPIVAIPTPTPLRKPADKGQFDTMFYLAVGCAGLGVLLLIIAIAMPKRKAPRKKSKASKRR